jgi:DNA-binding ferritin-like protein
MTLDDFAVVIQRDIARMATKDDLQAICEEMVTKADLWPMQHDIKTVDKNVRDLRDDVKQITDAMVSKADLANTLGDELAKSAYAREIDELRNRVNVLEKKLGIKPMSRAA